VLGGTWKPLPGFGAGRLTFYRQIKAIFDDIGELYACLMCGATKSIVVAVS
jgi:hypothetical protein